MPIEAHKFGGLLATICLLAFSAANQSTAAQVYSIDLSAPAPEVKRGRLDLGGEGPDGQSIEVNSFYLERNAKPFIPVVGEFHYCRYPAQYWEEELQKIKAGGITVVATYVFWNVHEHKRGVFDWSGDLNLRRFVELAKKCGLDVIVRIGPFAHGEIRNGGLPDWTLGQPFEVRSNDPEYLAHTERLYGEIAKQLKGLLYKDGGPVVGIQLENEFQHAASPWDLSFVGAPIHYTAADKDAGTINRGVSVSKVENKNSRYGNDHMVNLKAIAKKHGIDVPLYTATGWGNAAIVPKGSLPVTAGYAYPSWTSVPEPTKLYLFTDLRKHPDYSPVSFDTAEYPSIPAELGAGIQASYDRRPYVPDESVMPMIIRVLGSGSNGVGYYMYHGGANPVIGGAFFHEQMGAMGIINYDFQAPIGQYGQVRGHYGDLGLIHRFLASYGHRVAPLPSVRPITNDQIKASDTKTLRFAARAANGSGFLFLLNFQDLAKLEDLPNLQLQVADGRRTILLPSTGDFTLKAGNCAILPINLDLGGINLRSAMVQPFTILPSGGRDHFVFLSIPGLPPEFVFDSGSVSSPQNCQVIAQSGATIVRGPEEQSFSFTIDGRPVLVVPQKMARYAADGPDGRLLFADAVMTNAHGKVQVAVTGAEQVTIHAYPALSNLPQIEGAQIERVATPSGAFSAFKILFQPVKFTASLKQLTAHKYSVHLDQPLNGLADAFMRIDYVGDTGMAFVDGRVVDDHFYNGRPWEIGLKRFAGELKDKDMILIFKEMKPDATYMRDIPQQYQPVFAEGKKSVLEVHGLHITPEYRATLTFRSLR